jgi:hypothetical protein
MPSVEPRSTEQTLGEMAVEVNQSSRALWDGIVLLPIRGTLCLVTIT